MANRYVGDFKGTKQAVKALLLRLINGRRAFIQYCQSGLVQDETNERYALLFSQTQQVFPIVHGIKCVQLSKMLQSKRL
jgi:hypothetical protein